jgi:hypothetical protein
VPEVGSINSKKLFFYNRASGSKNCLKNYSLFSSNYDSIPFENTHTHNKMVVYVETDCDLNEQGSE